MKRIGGEEMEINNLEWRVIEVERGSEKLTNGNGEERYGKCRYYENEIYLDKELSEKHKKRVLAHELTHAYIYSHLLKKVETYTEEELCEFISSYGKQIWGQVDEYFFHKEIEIKKEEERRATGGKK